MIIVIVFSGHGFSEPVWDFPAVISRWLSTLWKRWCLLCPSAIWCLGKVTDLLRLLIFGAIKHADIDNFNQQRMLILL